MLIFFIIFILSSYIFITLTKIDQNRSSTATAQQLQLNHPVDTWRGRSENCTDAIPRTDQANQSRPRLEGSLGRGPASDFCSFRSFRAFVAWSAMISFVWIKSTDQSQRKNCRGAELTQTKVTNTLQKLQAKEVNHQSMESKVWPALPPWHGHQDFLCRLQHTLHL